MITPAFVEARTLRIAALLAASMLASPGFAQTAPETEAEPSDLTDVTATSFPAGALETLGIQSTLQLAPFVPNMFAANAPGLGSANSTTIRGLGNAETLATSDPSVITIIDGIALGRQNANNFGLFDVERIDVLRGPQGTLQGRNAIGGTVDVVLKRPATEFGGYGEFVYGAYDRKQFRASLDLPVGTAIGIKLSGYFTDDDGYVRNTSTGEALNDSDNAGLRMAVRLNLTERLSWNGSIAYMLSKAENVLNFACDPRDPANCDGRFASTGLSKFRTDYAPLSITGAKSGFGLGNRAENLVYTSNFEWAGDNATLAIITGLVDLKQRYAVDFADGRSLPGIADPNPGVRAAPLGGFTTLNDGAHRQFSQEVRLTGTLFGDTISYATGFYLHDESNRTDFADILTGSTGVPQLLADRTLNNSVTATAGYFQGDIAISDALKISGGIRYTDERRTLRIFDNRGICAGSIAAECLNQGSLFAANGAAIPTRQQIKIWTPRVAASFAVSDDLLFHASATRGFRSAGWNSRATRADALLPFGPETAWTYEAGVKSAWLDDRLRVAVTAFLLDASNLQTPASTVAANGAPVFTTGNAADYRNKGIEVELTATPVEALSLFASFGFQDDEYRIDVDAPDFDRFGTQSVARQQRQCLAQLAAGRVPLSGAATNAPDCATGIVTANGALARPVRSPRFTAAGGFSYDFKLPAAGIILTPSANLTYRSETQLDSANATIFAGSAAAGNGTLFPANPFSGDVISGSLAGSFFVANAALTMRTDDNNWTLALECFNCLDKLYVDAAFANASYLGPPRSWQVRLKRVF